MTGLTDWLTDWELTDLLMLCPLTPLLDKDHTQWVTEVFIQGVPEDNDVSRFGLVVKC